MIKKLFCIACLLSLLSNNIIIQPKQIMSEKSENQNIIQSINYSFNNEYEYDPYTDNNYLDYFDINLNDNLNINEETETNNNIHRDNVYLSLTNVDLEINSTAIISCIYPSGSSVSYMYWLSTNPNIATISSNGVISGQNPGYCSVYVMTMIDNNYYELYCPVFVYLSEGVYYIKNKYSSKYLEVKNGDINSQTLIQQYTKRTENENEKLRQMWKIHYLGNQSYSIRPMNIPVMPITSYCNSNIYNVSLKRNRNNENGLYDKEKWSFTYISANYGTGLTISNNNLSGKVLQVNTNGINTYPFLDNTISSNKILWEFEKINNVTPRILIYDTSQSPSVLSNSSVDILLGVSKTLAGLQRVVVYSSPTTLDQTMTISMAPNGTLINNNGVFDALLTGQNVIYFQKYDGNQHSSVSMLCHIFFPENTYYIMDLSDGKYITVSGNVGVNSDLYLNEYNGTNLQRWIISETSGGYYNIILESNNTYCIGTYGNSSSANTSAVLSQNFSSDYTQWRIAVTSERNYKLILKAGESNDIVLSTHVYSAIIDNFDEDCFTDWSLNIVDDNKYTNMLLGSYDGDFNAYSILNGAKKKLIKYGHIGNNYRYIRKNELIRDLKNTNIFTTYTHGSKQAIGLTYNAQFTIDDLNSISSTDLNDLKFICFGACSTGEGGDNETNLVNAFYNKGVDCVIGFMNTVNDNDLNMWLPVFISCINDGFPVGSALIYADSACYGNLNYHYTTSSDNRYVCGNTQIIPIN